MKGRSAVPRHKKKKNLFNKLKGYNQIFKASYTMGKTLLIKKSTHEFRSRKLQKRDKRSLFIQRINAAVRQLFNLSYSKFMYLVSKYNNQLNRKVMAHLCFNDLDAFRSYCESVITSANSTQIKIE